MAITSITSTALKAYGEAMKTQSQARKTMAAKMPSNEAKPTQDFSQTVTDSIAKVNDMQMQKNSMVESFAAGENQNVHELMISLQKAGLAMNLTSTVRNKIMAAYQEIMRMPM